jgi:hypothetical protein
VNRTELLFWNGPAFLGLLGFCLQQPSLPASGFSQVWGTPLHAPGMRAPPLSNCDCPCWLPEPSDRSCPVPAQGKAWSWSWPQVCWVRNDDVTDASESPAHSLPLWLCSRGLEDGTHRSAKDVTRPWPLEAGIILSHGSIKKTTHTKSSVGFR